MFLSDNYAKIIIMQKSDYLPIEKTLCLHNAVILNQFFKKITTSITINLSITIRILRCKETNKNLGS